MKEMTSSSIDPMENEVPGLDPFDDDDVVISGISGRFPLADNVEELKQNLLSKRNCIIAAEERWSSDFPGCPNNRMGIIKSLDKFDAEFFGMDATTANSEDPQNRLLLELSYEAIVDAGYDPEELRGKHIGVFVGESDPDPIALERNIVGDTSCKNAITYVACMAANRISRKYGFTGPSFTIDTACSSSGVALEDAFRRVKSGTIEAAIIGGTSLCLDPRSNKSYLAMGIISTTGESCSFDARASGLVKAEAVAAILIQKKKDARRIYAKIQNIECTAAGYVPEGIFVPTVKAEANLFRKTYERIGMDPSIIDYVEGHGTSTPVGDPTEVNAIEEVFCQKRKTPLLLGGLKSNIGHTEATSALCSIAKVILVFETGVIPPNINFITPNPKCPSLTNGKIQVVTEATPYDNPLAALNNFGFGGVSIHMIMERNRIEKTTHDEAGTEKMPKLVVYAATSEKALTDMFDNFQKNSMSREFFALLNKSAYPTTAKAPYRGFTILKKNSPAITSIERCAPDKRQVWYILTGMGCQWSGMGLDLMQLDVFAKSMRKSAKVLERFGIDLLELLQPNKDYLLRDRHITPAFVTIASIQIALVDVLKSLGLEPDGIVGHSTGELVCSYADGCCTAEQTILSAYYRGAAVECTELPAGAMAAVGLTWEEAKQRCPEGVYPACHNAEDSVTISGEREAVEKFVEQLKSENIFARIVNAYGYAFHCETISAVTETLRKHLLEVYTDPKPRSKRWLSSSFCEDEWDDPKSQIADANYFCHNLESQVHFREVLHHIPSDAITIEIGPHFLLQSILKRAIGNKASYIGLMKRNVNNVDFLISTIGKLYNLGLDPKVENLYSPISFPVPRGTPMISSLIEWNHSTSYYVPKYSAIVVGKSKLTAKTTSTESFLLDHCIEGRSLYPSTGYIYLAWKAFADVMNKPMESLPICIENFKILRATVLNSRDDKAFEVSVLNIKGDFEIVEGGAVVCTGKISVPTKSMFGDAEYHYEREKSSVVISGQEMYNELKIHGYEYGPAFQGLLEVNMEGTAGLVKWNNEWISFLDSLFLFFGIIYDNSEFKQARSALCIKIDPTVHANFVSGMEEQGLKGIPVKYDKHVRKCSAPGVEIRNLRMQSAPHRALSEIMPIVEEYNFVPYHEKSAVGSEKSADCEIYVQVCCQLAKQVADRLKMKGQVQSILQSVKFNRNIDVPRYLKNLDENHFLLKTIQNLLEMCDSPQLASQIQTKCQNVPDILTRDMLFKAILNEKPLRSILDVAVENCFGKMTVTEWSDDSPRLLTAVQDILKSFSLTKTRYNLIHSGARKVDVEGLSQRGILIECAAKSGAVPPALAGSCDLALACLMLDSSDDLSTYFQNICSLVKEGGFILVVHKHKLTPPELFMYILSKMSFTIHSEEAIENMFSEEKMTIISKKSGSAGLNVYLLRKISPKMKLSRIHAVKILDGKYDQWVGDLKKAMIAVQERGNSDKVVLVAQKTQTSGIIGLVNCLKQEPGGDRIRCIFTDSSAPPFDVKNSFYEDVLRKNLLMNVHMNGTWGSFRHISLTDNTPQDAVLCASIECTKLGDLSSFKWVESPVKHTNSHDGINELYHVYYASLNFKDVMIASGKISPDSDNGNNPSLLGMEFSGRDKNGRRIMAMTNGGCFSNAVVGKRSLVTFDIPDHWSLEEAATVPVVYSTCYFALIIKGKLQCKETILIHCGTGGIGQAAIRIALSMDCEIFTTVGTSEKRSFLLKAFPQLKPENIGCSRDTSFEEMVMNQTKGQGVDVVLNSLAGDKLHGSVRCLAKHGRFLELGKYDFALNNTIGLQAFLNDISFHAIYLHSGYNGSKKTNQFINRTKELLTEGIRKGVVQPLNTTVFPISDVEKAFRYMGSGKHTGKVLLKVRDEESKKIVIPPPLKVTALKNFCLSSNKSYIIIGGLGGFGIELAKWMIQKGAGTIILTSRHGPSTPYHHLCLKRWMDSGARVFVSIFNVEKRNEAEKLLKETTEKYGPIGGIFNLAVVLRDAFIENQTASYFEQISAPKAHATKHLDEMSRKLCPELDLFVCFSSIACGKGNAGQTNYGYANSVMERICEQRRRDGLHGLAIQWGIFDEVGLAHRNKSENSMMSGVMPQEIKSCLQCLERFLLQDKPVVSSFVTGNKPRMNKRSFDILEQMAKLFDINKVKPNCTFGEIGLDSLASVELKQMMESYFDIQFTLQEILDMKLDEVKKHLEERQKIKELRTDQAKYIKNITLNNPSISFPTEAIIALNSCKTGDPLFIIHGNDFAHEKLRKLSEHVSRPVFGLRSTKDTNSRSLKDMALWHLKQIQKTCGDRNIHLVSVSTAGNLALEMVFHSENQDLQPRMKNLIMLDGSMHFYEAYTTTEQEKKQNASTYEASDLCEFLSAFSDSDLSQLKAQLECLPTLESRMKMVIDLLSPADKSAFLEAAEFHLRKQNLMRFHVVTEVLNKDLTAIEASAKMLPNDVAPVKSLLQQMCSGRVMIHRMPGHDEFLTSDNSIDEISKLLNRL